MLSLQPENSRLDGCPRTLHGLVMDVLLLLVELGGLIAVAGMTGIGAKALFGRPSGRRLAGHVVSDTTRRRC
jgi:hypothetical protein